MPRIIFAPDLTEDMTKLVRKRCLAFARDLQAADGNLQQLREAVVRFRRELHAIGRNPTVNELKALVCMNVITDLVAHGWELSLFTKGRIKLVLDESDAVRSK